MRTIFLLFLCLIFTQPSIAKDNFILDSLGEAVSLSESTKQPILLIFGADYCRYCVNLKKNIIDLELSPEIDKYIICYIDIKIHSDLKKQYSVSTIPDSRIIIDNKQQKSIIGYNRQKYISWLKYDK